MQLRQCSDSFQYFRCVICKEAITKRVEIQILDEIQSCSFPDEGGWLPRQHDAYR